MVNPLWPWVLGEILGPEDQQQSQVQEVGECPMSLVILQRLVSWVGVPRSCDVWPGLWDMTGAWFWSSTVCTSGWSSWFL